MIKRSIRSALRRCGFELRRIEPAAPSALESFFQLWRRLAPPPRFIVDVGANRGNWTRTAIRHFPTARCLLIEPQESLRIHSHDLLAQPGVRWLTAGLSDGPGTLPLTLPPRDDSASFKWSEAEAAAAGYAQIAVPVHTLDEVLRGEPSPDLVKIDAEGFDLKVLRGAQSIMARTDVIFVECAVCAKKFENTFERVTAFMDAAGYRFFEITDYNRSPTHGALWLTEVAFVRKGSAAWAIVDRY